MKAKISLLARVSRPDGSHPFIVMSFVKGRPRPIPEATCHYVRYTENGKRVTESLGKNLETAFLRYTNLQLSRDAARAGIVLAQPKPEPKQSYTKIRAAYERYVDELHTLDRSSGTIAAYRTTIEHFLSSCQKEHIEEIDRADIVKFVAWMRSNLKRHAHGEQNTTLCNRLRILGTFLKHFGREKILAPRDYPRPTKKRPNRYQLEELQAMLKVATPEEAFMIEFFLVTGFRDMETAHAQYSDLDSRRGVIRVRSKAKFQWKMKDHEERDVPIPAEFFKKLAARKTDKPTMDDLIFVNSRYAPDKHLLDRLKAVGIRAGLPPSQVTLHKMRRTFACMMIKQFDIQTVQSFLGHSDIKTTMRYLAADDGGSKQTRHAVNQAFADILPAQIAAD